MSIIHFIWHNTKSGFHITLCTICLLDVWYSLQAHVRLGSAPGLSSLTLFNLLLLQKMWSLLIMVTWRSCQQICMVSHLWEIRECAMLKDCFLSECWFIINALHQGPNSTFSRHDILLILFPNICASKMKDRLLWYYTSFCRNGWLNIY